MTALSSKTCPPTPTPLTRSRSSGLTRSSITRVASTYDRQGRLLKTMTFAGYQQYFGKHWRPAEQLMQNHQTGKATHVDEDVEPKSNIPDAEFTPQGLARSIRGSSTGPQNAETQSSFSGVTMFIHRLAVFVAAALITVGPAHAQADRETPPAAAPAANAAAGARLVRRGFFGVEGRTFAPSPAAAGQVRQGLSLVAQPDSATTARIGATGSTRRSSGDFRSSPGSERRRS